MKTILLLVFLCHSLHTCGVALLHLRKPLSYYQETYGDEKWGLYKLMVLMDRERNRGQDGAGVAIVDAERKDIHIDRDTSLDALLERFTQKKAGRLLLGHLRYGTSGGQELKQCHPVLHRAETPGQTFALAGNFNLTNAASLLGANTELSDTFAMLKTLVQSQNPSLFHTLQQASQLWDGGYVVCLVFANGEAILCRDPAGIRPAYYVSNEEVFAVASERFALMDAFGAADTEIHPVPPGHAIYLAQDGSIEEAPFTDASSETSCVFERIYFSKGNDSEIYQERKALGKQLAMRVYEAIQGDLTHTIFTYVPNSSQSAFVGLTDEIDHIHRKRIEAKLIEGAPLEEIQQLLSSRVRSEILILKNQKVRTFISPDKIRSKWVSQLYEVTPSIVTPNDTLVVVDDSIVRGVTLKDSLMKKLIALNPKRIVIVSSAPPVCYPDCYGIDMSQLGRFVAFQAAALLFHEKENRAPATLAEIYANATLEEISQKVAHLITPEHSSWKGTVDVIYQSLDGLHQAIPSRGDWVFSGNYPTAGGYKVLNTSFTNWLNQDDSRSY